MMLGVDMIGQPIYEAFDSEEEYNEAWDKYEEQFWVEWEDWNKFYELLRTDPEAVRALAEAEIAESEFVPEPNPPRRKPKPCIPFYYTIGKPFTIPLPLNPATLLKIPSIRWYF
jgi:hypothetical protein